MISPTDHSFPEMTASYLCVEQKLPDLCKSCKGMLPLHSDDTYLFSSRFISLVARCHSLSYHSFLGKHIFAGRMTKR